MLARRTHLGCFLIAREEHLEEGPISPEQEAPGSAHHEDDLGRAGVPGEEFGLQPIPKPGTPN